MRIIRISGCHGCDCKHRNPTNDRWTCNYPPYMDVFNLVEVEKLPDNCPLEKDLEEETVNTISSNFAYVGRSKID